jgi:hypothetical protein
MKEVRQMSKKENLRKLLTILAEIATIAGFVLTLIDRLSDG